METNSAINNNLPGDPNSQQFRAQNQYSGQNTNEGINNFDQSNVRVGSNDTNSLEPRTQPNLPHEHKTLDDINNLNERDGYGKQDSGSDDGLMNDFEDEKEFVPKGSK